jgi:hypothetical protein
LPCLIAGVALVLVATGIVVGTAAGGPGAIGGTPAFAAGDDDDVAAAGKKKRRLRAVFDKRSGLYRITGFKLRAKHQHLKKLGKAKRLKNLLARHRKHRRVRPPDRGKRPGPAHPASFAGRVRPASRFGISNLRTSTAFSGSILNSGPSPSVGNLGSVQLVGADEGAAISTDNGLTYNSSLSLVTAGASRSGQSVPGIGFCCNNVVRTATRGAGGARILLWAFQTLEDSQGTLEQNSIVMHVFPDEQSLADADEAHSCRYVFSPSTFGLGKVNTRMFDRPILGSNDEHVFLSVRYGKIKANTLDNQLIIRMRTSDLFNCRGTSDPNARFDVFKDKGNVDYVPVDGAGSTMFLAAKKSGGDIRIEKWNDGDSDPTKHDVHVGDWSHRNPDCTFSPPGGNPCANVTTLLDTGFRTGNTVGWLYTTAATAYADRPEVFVAEFDKTSLAEVSPADNRATLAGDLGAASVYPSVAVNGAGDIAFTAYMMGGQYPGPSELVHSVTDPRQEWNRLFAPENGGVTLDTSVKPSGNGWGERYAIAKYDGCPNTWLAVDQKLDPSTSESSRAVNTHWIGDPDQACVDLNMKYVHAIGEGGNAAQGYQGGQVNLDVTVRNTGIKESQTPDVAWYLSRDTDRHDHDDVRIGPTIRFTNPLAPGEQRSSIQYHGTIPADFPGGPAHVIACIDYDNRYAEVSERESDNCKVADFQVLFSQQ